MSELAGMKAQFAEVVAGVFRPVKRLKLIEYCERNVVIDPAENPDHAGRYSADLVLPMARLFEEFWDSGNWDELHLAKCSQSTYSAHALMGLVRMLDYSPANFLVATHNANEAAKLKRRMKRFLAGNARMGGVLDDLDNETTKLLVGAGWEGVFIGSGSAGEKAGHPGVKAVMVDEVDKHGEDKGEPVSIHALRQRMKSLNQALLLSGCTPSRSKGQIWVEFLGGSRHRYFVPCPACGVKQWLKPHRLRYGHCRDLTGHLDVEAVLEDTRYECEVPGCGERIREASKPWMLENGEWRPTNWRLRGEKLEQGEDEIGELEAAAEKEAQEVRPGAGVVLEEDEGAVPAWFPRRMSAQLSELYSSWTNSSWGRLALMNEEAEKDLDKKRTLVTNAWAEPFDAGGMPKVSAEMVLGLRGAYHRGELPWEPVRLVFASDTQDDGWWWGFGVVNERDDLALVDWGKVFTFADLPLKARDTAVWQGKQMMADFGIVDEGGHRQREVRQALAGFAPWLAPSHGAGGRQVRNVLWWSDWAIDPKDAENSAQISVLQYDDNSFKRELYQERIWKAHVQRAKSREQVQAPARKLILPVEVDAALVDQLCAEQLVRELDKNTGRPTYKWITKGANHLGDVVKMLCIANAEIKLRLAQN